MKKETQPQTLPDKAKNDHGAVYQPLPKAGPMGQPWNTKPEKEAPKPEEQEDKKNA